MLRLLSGTDKQDQAIAEALSKWPGPVAQLGRPHPAGGGAHCSEHPPPVPGESTLNLQSELSIGFVAAGGAVSRHELEISGRPSLPNPVVISKRWCRTEGVQVRETFELKQIDEESFEE